MGDGTCDTKIDPIVPGKCTKRQLADEMRCFESDIDDSDLLAFNQICANGTPVTDAIVLMLIGGTFRGRRTVREILDRDDFERRRKNLCMWVRIDGYNRTYKTVCGRISDIQDGDFCQYCGKRIERDDK